MSWHRRLKNLFRSERLNREIEREMAFHFDECVDELVASGMSGSEARREARRRFGSPEALRERVHEVDVLGWVESLAADLRYALRTLRRSPVFTLVVVASLALGIGANTAIFGLVNAVLLRPLPVRDTNTLVRLAMEPGGQTAFTNPQWEQIRETELLDDAFASVDWRFDLTRGGPVRRASGSYVSGGYFAALGVGAAEGRVLTPADDTRGCPLTVVLSHAFWSSEHGASPAIVGRTISLDGRSVEVIGVAAPGFRGIHVGRPGDVFLPLCALQVLGPLPEMLDARSMWFLDVLGRPRPAQTLEGLQAALDVASPGVFAAVVPERYSAEQKRDFRERTLRAMAAPTGVSEVRGQYRPTLLMLLAVVGVVLLVACANVAQLLLARATRREHEIAVRLALGCSRSRLARQLLTESVLLALVGAALGTLFARWASSVIVTGLSLGGGRSVSLELALDSRVLLFTVALAVATGVLFGVSPAWRATRTDPGAAAGMRDRGGAARANGRVARGIVVWQLALSMVLVVTAGLLVGSFQRLATLDPGFEPEGVLLATASWGGAELPEARQAGIRDELLARVRQVPGARDAAAAMITPIGGYIWNDDVLVDDETPEDDGGERLVWFNAVSDRYFSTLDTRLLSGRDFTRSDAEGAPRVAVVNLSFARRFFGEASPLGHRLRTRGTDEPGPPIEIVGLVEDAKYQTLDEEDLPTAYVPLSQAEHWEAVTHLALRTDAAPTNLIPAVVEAVRDVHPGISLEFRTLREQVAQSLARPRLLALLSGFFGSVALLLAVIGLYGTMAYDVERRRGEIGVRMALGAERGRIVRMVATQGARMVVVGIAIGAGLTLLATRAVASFLYGVSASDPRTLATSALVLAGVALLAGTVPAWRAAGIDPMTTLREE